MSCSYFYTNDMLEEVCYDEYDLREEWNYKNKSIKEKFELDLLIEHFQYEVRIMLIENIKNKYSYKVKREDYDETHLYLISNWEKEKNTFLHSYKVLKRLYESEFGKLKEDYIVKIAKRLAKTKLRELLSKAA